MLDDPLLRQPLATLEKELMTLSGHMNAGEYRLLELIYALHERRSVEHYFDHDGMLHIRASLPAEDGMLFLAALERYSESIRRECEADEGAAGNSKDVSAGTRRDTAEQGLSNTAVTNRDDIEVVEPEKAGVDGVLATYRHPRQCAGENAMPMRRRPT